jgi:hypothetical protein
MTTKYDFNIQNFSTVINSAAVPEHDRDGLELAFGDTEVTIKKPYVDADGDHMGNSILILKDDDICISMRIESGFLFTFYRERQGDALKSLEAGSPEHIKLLAWQTWTAIVDYMDSSEALGSSEENNYQEFEEQFGEYKVPVDLKKLFEFQNEYGRGNYADSFCLTTIDKTGLKTYSEEESFLNSFIEFATATAGGSTYAIWVIHESLEKCPVVVFGDEGGVHPVADSIKDLIRLLTYDTEISVGWDSAYFYKDDPSEVISEYQEVFIQWVKANFALDPVRTDEDADLILKNAADKYGDSLHEFLEKYGIDVD